jgi:hypothetical protein
LGGHDAMTYAWSLLATILLNSKHVEQIVSMFLKEIIMSYYTSQQHGFFRFRPSFYLRGPVGLLDPLGNDADLPLEA